MLRAAILVAAFVPAALDAAQQPRPTAVALAKSLQQR